MQTPINRPMVLSLARVDASRRVIPASQMRNVEHIATNVIEAEARIKEAEAQCRAGLDRMAYQSWQEGFARGHTEALQKMKDLLLAVEKRRRSLDSELIELVDETVRRIIRRMPPDLLTENLIATALAEAQTIRGRLVLRVHPARVPSAEKYLIQAHATDDTFRVIVEADASMSLDDCSLETPAGTIDAGLQTQLAALREVLDQGTGCDV